MPMNDHCGDANLTRRAMLTSAAGLAITLTGIATGRQASAAAIADEHHGGTTLSAEQALASLKEGNQAFVAGRSIEPDAGGKRRLAVAQAQAPMAAVLSCSDSRVPPELIFTKGLGELFVIRNAGNTIDTVVMGSLEYAVAELKVPLIVVLGHERCGAVSAAVAIVETGATFPGSIGPMVEPILPAVLDARRKGASDLLDASVRVNVSQSVSRLRRASEPILFEPIKAGTLRIVGARYDLDDGKVDFFDV